MSAKTRSLADGQQLVTRADMEAYMQGAFHAYDRNARQVYGPRAVWLAPLRWVGALLRDLVVTLVGLAVMLGLTVREWREDRAAMKRARMRARVAQDFYDEMDAEHRRRLAQRFGTKAGASHG